MALLSLLALALVSGCSDDTPEVDGESDELRARTPVIELALQPNGTCTTKSPEPRVKLDRVVRLKNVGSKPIAALVELRDNFGGMPAPEGGDIAPGATISVKMTTRWWLTDGDDASREWSTSVVCRRGPWSDDRVDFDVVTRIRVYR